MTPREPPLERPQDGESHVRSPWTIAASAALILSGAAAAQAQTLFWTEGDQVRRAPADGSLPPEDLIQPVGLPAGFPQSLVDAGAQLLPRDEAVDPVAGKRYFADTSVDAIRRSNLDGSGVEDLVVGLLDPDPESVRLDVAAGKVYWIDFGPGSIQRANLDGSGVETLIGGLFVGPTTFRRPKLALDAASGFLYWTDPAVPTFHRAALDGSDPVLLFSAPPEPAKLLAVDTPGDKIYWAGFFGLRRASLDGSSSQLLTRGGVDEMILDLAGGQLYWHELAGWSRAALDGSDLEVLTAFGLPAGLALDELTERLYWSLYLIDETILRSANLDGSDQRTMAQLGTSFFILPSHLAPDSPGRSLFYSESSDPTSESDQLGRILRVSLDDFSTEFVNLFHPVASLTPIAVVPDLDFVLPFPRLLYWAQPGIIHAANLDGTAAQDLLPVAAEVQVMWIDTSHRRFGIRVPRLYWSEGTEIRRVSFDGSGPVETVVSGLSRARGLAIDAADGMLYWTDATEGRIQRSDLDGVAIEEVLADLDEPRDIAVFGAPTLCGDVDLDGLLTADDASLLRQSLADPEGSALPPGAAARCNTATPAGLPCDIVDALVLLREIQIPPLPPRVGDACLAPAP